MPQPNDEVVSVRLPRGTAAKLRAALNMPFSTFCRQVVQHVIRNSEAQLQERLLAEHKIAAAVKAEMQVQIPEEPKA